MHQIDGVQRLRGEEGEVATHRLRRGGIHLAGGKIIDARIHTTRDGLALRIFYVTDLPGGKLDSNARVQTLEKRLLEAAEINDEAAAA